MNGYFGTIVAAGGLLIATTAIAQRAGYTDYSANLAAASPTLSPEARQAMNDRIEAVNAKFREAHGGQSPEQFGLQCCQITQIQSAAFGGLSSPGTWNFFGSGYVQPVSGTLWAPASLPSGVEIEYLDLYYFDSDASADITVELDAYSGGGIFSGPPAGTTLAFVSSTGSSGYGYAPKSLTYVVNNNVAYDPSAGQLAIFASVNALPALVGFKAVDLWWMRQVSPAPATATFSDVPTTDPFFQYVEALAAAGITAGYPDGRFGVNDPITRGQMAVFLAKALGLYWPL